MHTCIHLPSGRQPAGEADLYNHTYTCIHAYKNIQPYMYMHTCIHAYMHTCIHLPSGRQPAGEADFAAQIPAFRSA